jgi:hypothetical protein
LDYPEYNVAYKNRVRELLDLLFNGEQTAQVIDEIAAVIATPYGGNSFVAANRALWDYHPRTVKKGQFYQNNEFLKTKDWPGLIEYYKAYLTPAGPVGVGAATSYGVKALVVEAADAAIPNTPVVTYTGPAGYPANNLKFQTTSFKSPVSTAAFAALKWRIARVEVGSSYVAAAAPPGAAAARVAYPAVKGRYEVDPVWESVEITSFSNSITILASAVEPGATYRVRCRMKDKTGRWSHWSDPVQFVAGPPQ